jgi:DNA-binding NarL/FixJ family response regulator
MILLVDQDVNFLRLLQEYLESRNYQVITTENEKQALSVLHTMPLDVVVAEMTSTQTDNGLLQQVRQNSHISWLPIILVSTRANKQERLAALKAGANAYLVKPFGLEEFTAQVESVMRLSQRLQSQQLKQQSLLQVPKDIKLTYTEQLVAKLVVEGKSNQEISQLLNISKRTIESHISHMLKKTELTNRTGLTRWLIESEIIQSLH